MFRKIIALTLATMLISAGAFASPQLATLETVYQGVFTYAESKVTALREADLTMHSANLSVWNGESKSEVTPVDGVYYIGNGAELAWLADFVNSGNASVNAVLTDDIKLNEQGEYVNKWTAIEGYGGTFDGKGHTIYGLYQSSSTAGTFGLFKSITAAGTVKNIHLKDVRLVSSVKTQNSICVAPVAGSSLGTIRSCTTEGTITNSGAKTYLNASGGIVGILAGNAVVENCISRVDITSNGLEDTMVTGDYFSGIGGIAGKTNRDNVTGIRIEKCGNEGNINAGAMNCKVGGIIGNLYGASYATVKSCYNTGNITAGKIVAGIGNITNGNMELLAPLYNRGDITALNTDGRAVGLIGNLYKAESSKKNGSYTTGKIIIPEGSTMAERCGLAYYVWDSNTSNMNNPNAHNFIYAEQTEGVTHPVGKRDASANLIARGTKMALNDIKGETALATLNGWSDNAYVINPAFNDGFPVFAWQTENKMADSGMYYLSDSSLTLILDEEGPVALDIIPIGNASVSVGSETKEIAEAGTYVFVADDEEVSVEVAGNAFIVKELDNQRTGKEIKKPENTKIKATFNCSGSATVVLVLRDTQTNHIQLLSYTPDAEYTDGTVCGEIDLSKANLEGHELKAYVWANGNLAPLVPDDEYVLR